MRKLLLVEDDRIIANIYQRKFAQDGFDVRVCGNGRDAIARFDEFSPEVVILDLNLPVLNGFEVLKHIRAASAELPVVVFSNAYQPKMIEEAWQGGASAVLMKANTNPKKMADTIRELLPAEAPAATPPPAATPTPPPVQRIAPPAEAPALEGLPQFLEGFSRVHEQFLAAPDAAHRRSALAELSRATNGLAGSAATVGMNSMARIAEAYQALLQAMHDRDELVSDSTRRSSAIALASIKSLSHDSSAAQLREFAPRALLADGNELSTRMARFAFQKAAITPTVVDHAETALKVAGADRFDIIALDSDVAGMTALDCAGKLRQTACADTPILLLFPAYEFGQHRQAAESLHADLLAKPYPAAELALLSICRVHRHRLDRSA